MSSPDTLDTSREQSLISPNAYKIGMHFLSPQDGHTMQFHPALELPTLAEMPPDNHVPIWFETYRSVADPDRDGKMILHPIGDSYLFLAENRTDSLTNILNSRRLSTYAAIWLARLQKGNNRGAAPVAFADLYHMAPLAPEPIQRIGLGNNPFIGSEGMRDILQRLLNDTEHNI